MKKYLFKNALENMMRRRFLPSVIITISVFILYGYFPAEVLGNTPVTPVSVFLKQNDPETIVLDYQFDKPDLQPEIINAKTFYSVNFGREAMSRAAGYPALPHVARSIIIPDDVEMKAEVIDETHYDIEDVDIAPSKGKIYRNINPKKVEYTFGTAYQKNTFFPAQIANLGKPYILRDYRGVVVTVNPFQYNPARRLLRVYTNVTVKISVTGQGIENVLKTTAAKPKVEAFQKLYRAHFLNAETAKKKAVREGRLSSFSDSGDILIIVNDDWYDNILPLKQHKIDNGIPATVVKVSEIGNNSTNIKAYIKNIYDTGGGSLAYVLLVGDKEYVDSPTSSGGLSDPTYSKLAGDDDYPDILVGRFSAENAAHVDTMVNRTIAYEDAIASKPDWYWCGMGIGSDQGPGDDNELDKEHIANIRTQLLAYNYTSVDEIYDPGALASTVTTNLNLGRGIINYTGHGSESGWGTTDFDIDDVNALENVGMPPFIFSVACLNGSFGGQTCFAEAWLRAASGGQPAGAIATYMSSVLQSWNPPMEAQDVFNQLLTEESYCSFAGFCFAGSCGMMDKYGSDGVEMFDTWNVFGDPSLHLLTLYELTVVSGSGSGLYAAGKTVDISADAPPAGQTFDKWTGDTANLANVNDSSTTITMPSSSVTVTATYKTPETCTVNFVAGANGSITGTAAQTVAYGGNCAAVTAVSDQDYYFDGWTGDYTGDDNPLTITNVTADMTITANFAETQSTSQLTIEVSPAEGGSTNPPAGTSTVNSGEPVQISATASDGYHFLGWTATSNATLSNAESAETSVTLIGPAVLIANFEQNQAEAQLTMAVSPDESGTTTPSVGISTQNTDEEIQITATAAEGFTFINWSADNANANFANALESDTTVILAGDCTITANFAENPPDTDVAYGKTYTLNNADAVTSKIYAFYTDPVKNTQKKVQLKIVSKLEDGVTLEWLSKIALLNKKVWTADPTKTAEDVLLENAATLTPLPCSLKMRPKGAKDNIDTGVVLMLNPPEITGVYDENGQTITSAGIAQKVVVKGKFFGKTPPVVWLEYVKANGKIGQLKLKVDKESLKYLDFKGKSSSMNILTGMSEIIVFMPNKWPKNWQHADSHNIVIDNKVCRATIAFQTEE